MTVRMYRDENRFFPQSWTVKYVEGLDIFTFVNECGLTPDHEDIVSIIQELCETYDALSPEQIQQHNQSVYDNRFPSREDRSIIGRVDKPTRNPLSGFVYLIQYGSSAKYKIGMSANPNNRIRSIQTSTPESLNLVHAIRTSNMVDLEFYFHQRFREFNIRGEWFELNDCAIAEFMSYEEVA